MARHVIDIISDLESVKLEMSQCNDEGESGEAELRRLQIRCLALERELDEAAPAWAKRMPAQRPSRHTAIGRRYPS